MARATAARSPSLRSRLKRKGRSRSSVGRRRRERQMACRPCLASATTSAAATLAPDEIPPGIPSTWANARKFESLFAWDGHDLIDQTAIQYRWDETGADALDLEDLPTAREHRTILRLDRNDLERACAPSAPGRRRSSVPPVPTPTTSASTLPAVSRQISSAVVRSWTSGLAGFSN